MGYRTGRRRRAVPEPESAVAGERGDYPIGADLADAVAVVVRHVDGALAVHRRPDWTIEPGGGAGAVAEPVSAVSGERGDHERHRGKGCTANMSWPTALSAAQHGAGPQQRAAQL